MLIVISPAKSLNMEPQNLITDFTNHDFMTESKRLVRKLKKLKTGYIEQLMDISPKLAQLNRDRYQLWHPDFTSANSKQAVLAFNGDVYDGLKPEQFSQEDFMYAQNHLRILSGLYGVLRPLDLIQAYRLEMGIKFTTDKWKHLYDFWGDTIVKSINKQLKIQDDDILINLASNEYFKSINRKKLKARIITPVFKDEKDGEYKMISFFAKKARGMMSSYIIRNKISVPEQLKLFDADGYFFNDNLSKGDQLVFTRA
jgi:uncharacterized protein